MLREGKTIIILLVLFLLVLSLTSTILYRFPLYVETSGKMVQFNDDRQKLGIRDKLIIENWKGVDFRSSCKLLEAKYDSDKEGEYFSISNDIVLSGINVTLYISSCDNNSITVAVMVRKLVQMKIVWLKLGFSTEDCVLVNNSEVLLNEDMLELLNGNGCVELGVVVLKEFVGEAKLRVWGYGKTYDGIIVVGVSSLFFMKDVTCSLELFSSNVEDVATNFEASTFIEHKTNGTKSPGTITVCGYWYYEDPNGNYVPIKNALVILYDDDPLGVTTELARTYTDDSGYYEFPPIENNDGLFEDGYDVWVAVYCENSYVKVTDGGASPYGWRTSKIDNVPDGFVDMGSWRVVDDSSTLLFEPGCWEIFDHVNNAVDWIYQWASWTRDQVTVFWPYGDWPCTDGNIIYIPDGDWYADAAAIYHEYGHTVMYAAYGGKWPDHGNYDSHYVFSDTDLGFSFVEGWAEFMECAVDDNVSNLQSLGMNIEDNDWYNVMDDDDLDGAFVEGSVASILWDIYDEINATEQDNLYMGFDEVFDVLLNYNPSNIYEFWDYFVENFNHKSELRDIYYHYGINMGKKVKWTFMVYMDGDNNLETAAIDDLLEMGDIGSNENLSIVVMLDRIDGYNFTYNDWTDTKIFYVTKGFEPYSYNAIADMNELNMGDYYTLYEFVTYAVENYPADHYALVLWDHGGGWIGCCWDDSSGDDHLEPWEIRTALNVVKSCYPDFHLNIVGFDACLMASLEMAFELANPVTGCFADYLVASEEVEPGDGWPYDLILNLVKNYPDLSPALFADWIAYLYVQSYNGGSQGYVPIVTQSAIDLQNVENLARDLGVFVKELLRRYNLYENEILSALENSEIFGYPSFNFTDLYHFAYNIRALIDDLTIRHVANSLLESISNTVIASYSLSGHPNAHGVSVYTGIGTYDYYEYYGYDYLFSSYFTLWDDLVRAINGEPYDAWFYDVWLTNIADEDNDSYYEAITLNWDVDAFNDSLEVMVNVSIYDSNYLLVTYYTVGPYAVSNEPNSDNQNIRIFLSNMDSYLILLDIYVSNQLVYRCYYILGVSDDIYPLLMEPDTFGPHITAVLPSNETCLPVTDLTVSWSGFDSGSGIDHYEIKLDDGEWLNIGVDTSYVFEDLNEGQHIILIKAVDKVGNEAIYRLVVTIDRTPPSVVITFPEAGKYVSGTISINVSAEDVESEVEKVSFIFDGILLYNDTEKPYEYSFDSTLYLDGSHNLTVVAYDKAGNNKTASITFYIDNTEPSVSIVFPIDGSWVGTYVYVNVSASDELSGVYAVELLINGSSQGYYYPPDYDIYWDATEYAEGTYNLTVVAYDNVNNTASKSIVVHLDKTSPVVGVVSPANRSWVSGVVEISVPVSDVGAGVDYVVFGIYGQPELLYNDTAEPYEYSWDTRSYAEGKQLLAIIVKDKAGNYQCVVLEYYVDNTPPSISAVEYPSEVKGNEVAKINVTVIDVKSGVSNVILSYSVDGGETWTNLTMDLREGNVYGAAIPGQSVGTTVQFKIIVFDAAGNMAVSPTYSYKVVSKVSWTLIGGVGVVVGTTAVLVFVLARRKGVK